jgi:hypothetical protein
LLIYQQGEMMYVDDDITHDFVRIICRLNDKDAARKNHMIWKDKIVISHQEADRLPGNIAHGEFQVDFLGKGPSKHTDSSKADCHVLCNITSNLSSLTLNDFDLVKEHKSWFKRITPRDKYRTAEHQIKVVIGPADIQFELWYDGSQYNKPNSIRVDWEDGATVSAPNLDREPASSVLLGIRQRKPMKSQRDKEKTAHALRKGLRSPRVRRRDNQ